MEQFFICFGYYVQDRFSTLPARDLNITHNSDKAAEGENINIVTKTFQFALEGLPSPLAEPFFGPFLHRK